MEYDGCVCSSGFALADELKTTEVNKDFLLFFLKSSAGLRQLERRMTGGLYPAIVQGELEKIRVPLPPMTLQQKIVKEMKEKEMEIARERKKGEQLTAAVSQEVEDMILGVRSVSKVEGPQEGKV
jgi:type I restriction enzyme S subunit